MVQVDVEARAGIATGRIVVAHLFAVRQLRSAEELCCLGGGDEPACPALLRAGREREGEQREQRGSRRRNGWNHGCPGQSLAAATFARLSAIFFASAFAGNEPESDTASSISPRITLSSTLLLSIR